MTVTELKGNDNCLANSVAWGQLKPPEVVPECGHHPPTRERVGALVNVYMIVGLPYFAMYNVHPCFYVHYTQDYYPHGM